MSANCAYCDAPLRPNSMFCLECGQLVAGAAPPPPANLAGGADAGSAAPAAPAPSAAPAGPAAPVTLPPMWQAPGARPAEQSGRYPVSPGRPATPAAAPTTVTLSFSTGDRAVVSGSAVIGRQPQSTAQNSGAQAVEIRDTTRSVSRVHLMLAVAPDGVRVTDAGSGNGSALERGGVKTPLREGRAVDVAHGDRLWLGDVSADVELA